LDRLDAVPWRQAVESALAVLGLRRRWEVAILVALAQGELHFTALLDEINAVEEKFGRRDHDRPLSGRTLSDALIRMERDGLLTKHADSTPHPSVRYRLTSRGQELLIALRPLVEWSLGSADVDSARSRYYRGNRT
jgi:DNA-binding HxlR family transcriptional regulator